jgi:glyoxylase-like metal-dependent hydrolase (beta-lactamase superfamily II)
MKKIRNDLYQITLDLPFPFSNPSVNIYYIDGERPALIDSGFSDGETIRGIDSQLDEIGRSIEDLSVIINTHEHIEHFGGNRKIKEVSAASIITSSKAAPMIEKYHTYINGVRNRVHTFDPEMKDFMKWYLDFNITVDESPVDQIIDDGDIIDLGQMKLRVIATPGHAHGHVCLYDEERQILFTGDHIIGTGTTFVGFGWRELATKGITDIFYSDDEPDNLSSYLDSLKQLSSLNLKLLLPGHGLPIDTPYAKIEGDRKKKLERERMLLEILSEEELSLDEIISRAYGKKTRPHLLRGSVLGYLGRLNRAGKITVRFEENTLFASLKRG